MGMTMTQKILAKHAGLESVRAGQLIQAKLDLVLGNDITTPVAINEFESAGFEKVFDKSRIAMVMDHFAPNKDIKSATQCKQCRTFARRFDIDHFYDVGTMGIEHALLPEQGLVAPGEAVIGADSHTCTYGALGAFSTGVGSTDMGAAMAAGETWFKVPSAIKVNLTGKLRPFVSGKDVILTLIGMIGVDGARYQSIEFSGEGVKNLTIYDRLTICNMAIEAGGKNGIFPVDDVTRAYVEGRVDRPWTAFEADPDAEYERVIDIDLGKVDCTVAWPHLPENAHSAREGSDIAIEAARMTVLSPDLRKIPEAIRLSRLTVRTVRENLFWAFIYNLIGVPVAAGLFYPLWGFQLDPMIAGAAMAMSSVSVVANSLRLKRRKIGQPQKRHTMEKRFRVEGMMCDHCRAHVEKALNSVAGVSASVTLSPPVAAVVFAGDTVPVETLQRAVDELAGDYRLTEL